MHQRLLIFIPSFLSVLSGCSRPCPAPNSADQAEVPVAQAGAAACPEPARGESQSAPAHPAQPAPAPDANTFAPGQQQIVQRAADVKFGPCPPTIPFACEMAVLEGTPKGPGLFTVRVRTQEPWVMPPHTHPRAERVTVISGKLAVGFGAKVDKTKSQQFTVGDYYVNAPGAVHYVWSDDPTEIQITGMGPWEVHPVATSSGDAP